MGLVNYMDVWWFTIITIAVRFMFNMLDINKLYEKNRCYIISTLEIIKKSLFYLVYDILFIKNKFSKYFILKQRSKIYNKVLWILMLCFISGLILMDSYLFFIILKSFGYHGSSAEFLLILLFTYNTTVIGFYFMEKRNNRSTI